MATAARGALPVGTGYVGKASGCFLVVAALVVVFRPRWHPFARFGPANHVTTARAALVALIAGLLGEPPSAAIAWAIVLTSLAAEVLDGIDGWLARRTGLASGFGARFDMEVDAWLILVLSMLVWQHERAGAWIVLAGLLRYLFVAAGWFVPWMQRPLPSSVRRQAICVVQIAGLIIAMVPWVPQAAAHLIAAASLAALVCSFAVDTIWLRRAAAAAPVSA